ncbi:MAG: hypothetical protein K8S56_02445 [Candidatus Cloacimonetes bacterium]|nr:hypothetical protein [Candidatus Cloacimonadota bacterium]
MMFWEVFKFEFNYRSKMISTYVYFILFAALGFLFISVAGGLFSGVNVMIGGGSEQIYLNSPFFNLIVVTLLSLFTLFITAAFVGNALSRDYETKSFALFYSKPINKNSFIISRIFSNTILVFLINLSLCVGLIAGAINPFLSREMIGPFYWYSYLHPCLTLVLPNIILCGAIFALLLVFTRRLLYAYIAGIVLFVGYLISISILSNIELKSLASLIDPFGIHAAIYHIDNWTVFERNSQIVPLAGLFLYNRLIWLGVSVVTFAVTLKKFRFSYFLKDNRKSKKQLKKIEADRIRKGDIELESDSYLHKIPLVKKTFNLKTTIAQMLSFTKVEFASIIKSPAFWVITFLGLLEAIIATFQSGQIYATRILPVTWSVAGAGINSLKLLAIVLITIYCGEFIWRDRYHRIDSMIDSTPVRNFTFIIPKFLGVLLIIGILHVIVGLLGMLFQAFSGFYDITYSLYVKYWIMALSRMFVFVSAAFFIHIIVNQKYAAHFVFLGLYFSSSLIGFFGIDHRLLKFNSAPSITYSDMNGFGHFFPAYFWFRLYWVLLGIIMLFASYFLFVRGKETVLKTRIMLVRKRTNSFYLAASIFSLVAFVSVGGFLWYNTNVLNEWSTSREQVRKQVEYEKTFKQYENLPMPKITDVNIVVDIYPNRGEGDFAGTLILKNKNDVPISEIHIEYNDRLTYTEIAFSRPNKKTMDDEVYAYQIYELAEPLAPGDDISMTFACEYRKKGIFAGTSIVPNGSFINNMFFTPSLGYSGRGELSSVKMRKKHGLPPQKRFPKLENMEERNNNFVTNDADWVNFEAVVSTSENQIAITPGYFQNTRIENGRAYFHYKMNHPIINFFAFVSGKYDVATETWTGKDGHVVNLEIYHHHKHKYNVDRMLKGLQKGLTYFTENFSNYPDSQVRIIEFPRYSAFAQSFPNTIPFSEAIGFLADVDDDENDIDYPFYITAHELGHQWWAHQIIGGNVQGAQMLCESMAQYSALMVMEDEYGEDQMEKFLKHELNTYVMARGSESVKEDPLYKVETQQYIYYNKGSVIMYSLKDLLGEEVLNSAISEFVYDRRWQEPPYPASDEFLSYIKAVTPDSLQNTLTDMFEKITIFDNSIESAEYVKLESGRYEVTVNFKIEKTYADSFGKPSKVTPNDYIDVVVYAKKFVNGKETDKPVYNKKHLFTETETELKITVDTKPVKVGLDPSYKIVDRSIYNNSRKVKKVEITTNEETT